VDAAADALLLQLASWWDRWWREQMEVIAAFLGTGMLSGAAALIGIGIDIGVAIPVASFGTGVSSATAAPSPLSSPSLQINCISSVLMLALRLP